MYLEPFNEIIKSVNNVFQSSFSSSQISNETGISYTAISELRNNKRDIRNASFSILKKIYQFAKSNNLDNEFVTTESRKGSYKFIKIDLPIQKILVSFEELDLLAYGYSHFKKTDNHKPEIQSLTPSQNLFVTEDNILYDPEEFGLKFQCRYGGTGPNNLVRFIEEYSKISKEELEQTIFTNSVVEYDFVTDTIKGLESRIEGRPFSFYEKENRFIITLNDQDIFIHDINDTEYSLLLKDLDCLLKILEKTFNFSNNLLKIHYVPDYQTAEQSDFSLSSHPSYSYYGRPLYKTILEFKDFEIWLPHSYIVKNNALKSAFITSLLEHFNKDLSLIKNIMATQKNEDGTLTLNLN